MYQFCLVQAVDGLGQRIVIALALTAHRRLNSVSIQRAHLYSLFSAG
jgi:hypothetical protein